MARPLITAEERFEIAKALAKARAHVALAHVYLDRIDRSFRWTRAALRGAGEA